MLYIYFLADILSLYSWPKGSIKMAVSSFLFPSRNLRSRVPGYHKRRLPYFQSWVANLSSAGVAGINHGCCAETVVWWPMGQKGRSFEFPTMDGFDQTATCYFSWIPYGCNPFATKKKERTICCDCRRILWWIWKEWSTKQSTILDQTDSRGCGSGTGSQTWFASTHDQRIRLGHLVQGSK